MNYKGFVIEEESGIFYARMPEPIFESTDFGWYHSLKDAKEFIDTWLKTAKIKKLVFVH